MRRKKINKPILRTPKYILRNTKEPGVRAEQFNDYYQARKFKEVHGLIYHVVQKV